MSRELFVDLNWIRRFWPNSMDLVKKSIQFNGVDEIVERLRSAGQTQNEMCVYLFACVSAGVSIPSMFNKKRVRLVVLSWKFKGMHAHIAKAIL